MKKFTISEDLGNKILNYLAARPFAEVFQLINELDAEVKKSLADESEIQDANVVEMK
jgi:hypothetical protein